MDFRGLFHLNNQYKTNITALSNCALMVVLTNFSVSALAENSQYLFPSDYTDGLDLDNTRNKNYYPNNGDPSYYDSHYSYDRHYRYPERSNTIEENPSPMYYPQTVYPPSNSYTRNDDLRSAPDNAAYNPYSYVTDIDNSLQQQIDQFQKNMHQLELQRNALQKEQQDYEQNFPGQGRNDSFRYNDLSPRTYAAENYSRGSYPSVSFPNPVQTIPVPVMTVPGTLPGTVPGVVTPNYMVPGYSHLSPDYGVNPSGSFIPGTGFGSYPGLNRLPGINTFPGVNTLPGINTFPGLNAFPYGGSGMWPATHSFSNPGFRSPYSYR